VGNFLVWVIWFLAAAGCLGSGLAVITFTNPFYSALALIGNLGSLAVLFLLASAEFLAAAQVLVYAGAVMVMFLFVIAYLGDRSEGVRLSGGPSWVRIGAIVAATALLVEVVVVIGLAASDQLADPAEVQSSFDDGVVRVTVGAVTGTYAGPWKDGAIQVKGPLAPLCPEIRYAKESGKLLFCGEEFVRTSK